MGEGDLAGARAGLRDVPPTLDRGAIAAYMANYWDMYWALDSTDRALVLTLGPAAFDNDRGTWGIVHAQIYWLAGDTLRARRSADSARAEYEAQLRATPDDFQRHLFRGLVLAYLGQRAAAVREGTRGLTLAQATGDVYSNLPYTRHLLARLYLAIGEHDKALAQLDSLLANPYFVSPKWLAIDPTWAPLKGEARFQQLIAATATSPARIAMPASIAVVRHCNCQSLPTVASGANLEPPREHADVARCPGRGLAMRQPRCGAGLPTAQRADC